MNTETEATEHVIPEMEDFDAMMREHGPLPDNASDEELGSRYRLAQIHKVIRLQRETQVASDELPPAQIESQPAEGQPIPEPPLAAETNGDEEEEEEEDEEEEQKEEEKKDEAAQAS